MLLWLDSEEMRPRRRILDVQQSGYGAGTNCKHSRNAAGSNTWSYMQDLSGRNSPALANILTCWAVGFGFVAWETNVGRDKLIVDLGMTAY